MDLAFQDIKHDILHTRDPFQNGHPFISFWPQLENLHEKDNFGTSTLSGEKKWMYPTPTIPLKETTIDLLFFVFFPTELLMKLSDWVRKWPFDHPNGGHLTLNPWKGHLKPPRNPTKYGDFPWKKPSHIFTTQSFAKLYGFNNSRILCTLQRWQLPVGGPKFTKTTENGFHDPTGFF